MFWKISSREFKIVLSWASQAVQTVKNLLAKAGGARDVGLNPSGVRRSSRVVSGNPSILAWKMVFGLVGCSPWGHRHDWVSSYKLAVQGDYKIKIYFPNMLLFQSLKPELSLASISPKLTTPFICPCVLAALELSLLISSLSVPFLPVSFTPIQAHSKQTFAPSVYEWQLYPSSCSDQKSWNRL